MRAAVVQLNSTNEKARNLGTADPEQKTSVLVARLQALNTESSAAEADRIAKEAVYREARDGTLPEVEVCDRSRVVCA